MRPMEAEAEYYINGKAWCTETWRHKHLVSKHGENSMNRKGFTLIG